MQKFKGERNLTEFDNKLLTFTTKRIFQNSCFSMGYESLSDRIKEDQYMTSIYMSDLFSLKFWITLYEQLTEDKFWLTLIKKLRESKN